MEFRLFSLLCLCIYSINGLPQFGFPFSKFTDFALPEIPSFGSDDFALPEAGLRMALPSVDGTKVNKTTSKKKLKDGTVVKTTNINGPNFMVHEESAFKSSKGGLSSNTAGKEGKFPNIGSLLLGGVPMLGNLMRPDSKMTKKECKSSCKSSEFCDEDIGKCVPRLGEGFECMANKNCEKDLKCVWGICNKANNGESGTLCNTAKDCEADMNCINLGNLLSEDKFCTPKMNEGAVCGGIINTASGNDEKINPCARGLKCALVGSSENKLCVRESYKEAKSIYEEVKKAEKEEKDLENKEKGNEDEEDENDDTESGDDDEDDESIPVITKEGQELPKGKKAKDKKNDKSQQTVKNKKTGKKEKKKQQQQKDNKLKFVA